MPKVGVTFGLFSYNNLYLGSKTAEKAGGSERLILI
jgi:hypothetical protein